MRISGTDKTDNRTCEIVYDNFTYENYRFSTNHVAAFLVYSEKNLISMQTVFFVENFVLCISSRRGMAVFFAFKIS